MSWSDKAKSGSGAIEGVITDYAFMDTHPFATTDDDDNKKDNGKSNLYMLLEVTPDGAEEPIKKSFWFGGGDFLSIEDDGKTLISTDKDGTPKIYEKGEVFRFIVEMEDGGFPAESRFPDVEEEKKINFEGMLNWRIRLVNEVDEESQIRIGRARLGSKANGASREKLLEAGRKLSKKGKSKGKYFPVTRPKVAKVFGEIEASSNGSGKSNGKVSTKSKKAVEADDEDEAPTVSRKVADKFLLAMIAAQPKKSVDKDGLALAITRYAAKIKMDNDERDALRQYLVKDEFSAIEDATERDIVAVSKKGVITVPEGNDDE